jgi:hypothetical protein
MPVVPAGQVRGYSRAERLHRLRRGDLQREYRKLARLCLYRLRQGELLSVSPRCRRMHPVRNGQVQGDNRGHPRRRLPALLSGQLRVHPRPERLHDLPGGELPGLNGSDRVHPLQRRDGHDDDGRDQQHQLPELCRGQVLLPDWRLPRLCRWILQPLNRAGLVLRLPRGTISELGGTAGVH